MSTQRSVDKLLDESAKKKIPTAPLNLSSRVWHEIEIRENRIFGFTLPPIDFRFVVASIGLAVAVGIFSSYFFVNKADPNSATHQFKQAYSLDFFSAKGDRLVSYYGDRGSK